MQVSKSILLFGFAAAILVGCGEHPKAKFLKGADQSAKLHAQGVCDDDAVKFCAFSDDAAAAAVDSHSNFGIQHNQQSPYERATQKPQASQTDVALAARARNNPAYGPGYAAKTQPRVAFKEKDQTRIHLNFSIDEINKDRDDKDEIDDKVVALFIAKACLDHRIDSAFNKSYPGLNLLIDIENFKSSSEKDSHPALTISLRNPRVSEDKESFGRMVMVDLPFHSDLYPLDMESLKNAKGEKCDEGCRIEKSDGFCRSLAKMIAHGIGIQDPVALKNKCDANGFPEDMIEQGSAAAGNIPGDKDFWSRPFLVPTRDRLEIERPKCSNEEQRLTTRQNSKNTQTNGVTSDVNPPADTNTNTTIEPQSDLGGQGSDS
jgi:hypothetical protein